MSDEQPHDAEQGDEEDEVAEAEWPVKGPASAQQAIVAIGFVFLLGLVIGFALARAF